jgi:hypothetical protein
VAETLFGDEEKRVRIDMPGISGRDRGGQVDWDARPIREC